MGRLDKQLQRCQPDRIDFDSIGGYPNLFTCLFNEVEAALQGFPLLAENMIGAKGLTEEY